MRRLFLTLFIFGSLIYVTGCKDKIEDPQEGYFKGRVVDTLGHPIDSVKVATFPPHTSTYTDSNGYFTLRAFPRTYRLDLRKGQTFRSVVESTGAGVDTVEIGIYVLTSVETLYHSIDSSGGVVVETTIVHTTTDSCFYTSFSTDSVDLQSGQTFNFGILEMDTSMIRIEAVDTVVDTLQ